MSDVITLANKIAAEKENIRQAIETRGVDIPDTTPLSDYPAAIMAIDTENTASDVYYRDPGFDTSATSFTLPGNYGVVADGALAGYNNLESVDLQYANAVFPDALADNANLASFTGDHLKYVGNNAFASTGLEALNNSHIQRVDNGGFENCKLLESVSLPNCTHIGSAAFAMNTALESVSLPECTEVGSFAFEGNSMLTSISLPIVEKIPSDTFRDCGNAAYSQFGRTITVDMPECTKVGANAFRGVGNIVSISLPSCTSIGNYAFYKDGALSTYPEIVDLSSVETLGSYNFVSYNGSNYSYYAKTGRVINMPNCTSIGESSFRNMYASAYVNKELVISDLGCTIGNYVFSSSITNVTSAGLATNSPTRVIGKLTEVGAYSFEWTINQSSTTLNPNSVVNIDIDFSSIRYLRDYTYNSSSHVAFNCYNQGASNATIGSLPYFNFVGGALDFSSFIDTTSNYGTQLAYAPCFFSASSSSSSDTTAYSMRSHNVRKIWIPKTCNRIKIGLMGSGSSDLIHIYTDASAANSNWQLANRAMNSSDLSTTAYGIVHTNCTHQDFIDGTYNI